MKYRHSTQTRSGWGCPASTVPVRSSKRPAHALQRYRCRCGWVSSQPSRTTDPLPQTGQRTPSGQRCCRTRAKHLASSISAERLTRSGAVMVTEAPRMGRSAIPSPTHRIIEALSPRYPGLDSSPRIPTRATHNMPLQERPLDPLPSGDDLEIWTLDLLLREELDACI